LTTPVEDFERMLEISEKMVAFIQDEVDKRKKTSSSAVVAAVGD
jgi:hypothetical protein